MFLLDFYKNVFYLIINIPTTYVIHFSTVSQQAGILLEKIIATFIDFKFNGSEIKNEKKGTNEEQKEVRPEVVVSCFQELFLVAFEARGEGPLEIDFHYGINLEILLIPRTFLNLTSAITGLSVIDH